MRLLFKSRFFLAAAGIFTIVFALSQTTLGQEVISDASSLTQLIESQNRIAVALEQLVLEDDKATVAADPMMEVKAMAAATSGNNIKDCIEPLWQLPESTVYKTPTQIRYDFLPMVNSPSGQPQFRRELLIDVNADGLLDYLYSETAAFSSKSFENCIYLNTGHSFEKEYACVGYEYNGAWTYRGDCADYS
jgi:hypothetical protein